MLSRHIDSTSVGDMASADLVLWFVHLVHDPLIVVFCFLAGSLEMSGGLS